MADEFAIGKALEIPDNVLKNIEKIDQKINDISKDSEIMAQKFNSAMIRMGNGSDALLKKLQAIQGIIGNLGNVNVGGLSNMSNGMTKTATEAEKAANSITKAANAMNSVNNAQKTTNPEKSVAAWQKITEKIIVLEERQKELTKETERYEKTLANMKSGKGGALTKDMQDQYKAAQKELEVNNQLIASYKQKQQAIIAYQQEQKKQLQYAEALKNIASGGTFADAKSAETLRQMKEYYRQLEKTSADADKKRQAEAKKTAKEIENAAKQEQKAREQAAKSAERQQQAEEKLRKSQEQKANTAAINAYNRAMASSEALVSQRINKIAKLRQAEDMLVKTGKDYSANITKIRSEIERLNRLNQGQVDAYGRIIKSQHNLMNTSGQLMRKLALIFSISQIQSYLIKVRDVTGEFEKQNVALATLLQNKDKADKLFGQITELAVKSPFTLKELITYTKSLAAYQVEYEKLYDTTKMLADVSAGLGVDMQRLILAFGQVKASNFLRGTEVRQFTEAGLNILGELAKYYSELEGRMITVGDVQEMVTKRMVAFGDVEEVFKRVTSAGGIFYKMQERQAETLAGQVSNLNDSIDLMLNDIGKANMTTMKDLLSFVRDIIKNWREVAWYLKQAVVVFGAYKTVTLLASVGNSKFAETLFNITKTSGGTIARLRLLSKTLTYLKTVAKGVAASLAAIIPTLLITWLIDLWRQSTKTSRELDLLNKSLDSLINADYSNLSKATKALDDLLARYKMSNEGSQERRDIISTLNSNYGEYLDFVVKETTTLEELTSAYDDVIERMHEKAALQTLEKGYQQINNQYEESLTEAREAFENELSKGLKVDIGSGIKKNIIPTEEDINNLYKIIQQKVRETDTELLKGSREQRNLFQEIVQNYYGKDVSISQDYLKTIPLIDAFIEKKEAEERLEKNINSTFKETLQSREAYLALQERENQLAQQKKDIENKELSAFETKKELEKAVQDYELDVVDIKLKFGEISEEEAKKAKDRIINWANGVTKDLNENLKKSLVGFNEADIAKALITPKEQATGISVVMSATKQNWETQNSIILQQTQLKNEGLSIDEKTLENAIKMEKIYRTKAELLGVELDYQEKINDETLKSINERLPEKYQLDLVDALKSQVVLLEEANKKYSQAEAQLKQVNAQKSMGVIVDEEARKGLEEDLKNYDLLRRLLGYTEKEGRGSRKNPLLEQLKEQLSFFEKVNKEYEKLQKNYNDEEAKLRVINALKEEAKQKGVESIFISAEFDDKGTLASMEKVKAMYKNMSQEMKIAFAEAFGGIQLDLDIELRQDRIKTIQDQFSDLFGNYELSLELENLGLDKDLTSQLFGIEVFDLAELRKQLEPFKKELQNTLGKDGVSAWEEMDKKISEMEAKELQERLKTYAQYLKKSISAKAQAEIESQKEIAKIQKTEGLSYEAKTALIKQRREETVKIKAELEWEDFKSSDTYIKMFDDLEYVSDAALKRLKQNLDMVKNSMGELEPDQLKAIQDAYNKIEEQVISRNPFAAMRDAMKEVNELQSQGLSEDVLQQNLLMYDAQAQSLKTQISDIETIIGLKQNGISLDTQEQSFLDRNIQYLDQNIESLRQMVTLKKATLSGVETNIGITNKDLASYEKARMSLDVMSAQVETLRNLAQSAFGSIKSVLESIGVESDSTAMIFADMGMSMVDLIAQAVMFGLQLQTLTVAATVLGASINTALGPIGWAVMAIQGIAMALTAIFQVHDKKKEQEIERQLELIDKLQKSYKKLEEAIDSAYSIDTLKGATKQSQENLKQQNEALKKAIAAEEDKKKTDDDRIKEWQQQYEDNLEKMKELQEQYIEELGGFGSEANIKSAAQEFADAWLEAYLETGDGLDALSEKWDEYIQNVIAKQLMLRGTEKYLQPVMDMLDGMLEDGLFTSSEAQNIQDKIDEIMPQLNEFWKSIAGSFDLDKAESDGLSGLSRGIQAVSETTAQALEAILSSMRYFVADSNTVLKQIYNAIILPNVENPFLMEMKLQTEQLRIMSNLWSSLSMTKPGINGKCLRVNIV